MYPIDKYKFVVRPARTDVDGTEHGPEVIAISHYAGQVVKGVAKCDPRDEFDIEFGKRLAAARCNQKVCEKRAVTLSEKCDALYETILDLTKTYNKMVMHKVDALENLAFATSEAMDLEDSAY